MAKLFGTDGIRGTANSYPVTADIALKLGMAAGTYFNRGDHLHRVVIAKDTRLSGYMLEPALTSGFIATGMDVVLVGPMPTPAVAMLVTSMRADLGVMISASHNPYQDNGIKLFGPDGYKLSDQAEAEIGALMQNSDTLSLAAPDKLGRAKRLDDARGRYIEFAKSTFPKNLTLENLSIVLDCANGAAYQVGALILRELGAKVTTIGVDPNGFNINEGCGSTAPQAMREMVKQTGADIGIALDGDADRVIICDEKGEILDGDQLLALIATSWKQRGVLKGDCVVATQMSNMGLERYLNQQGLGLARTKVGDRYVIEYMREHGCNIGGEQSGHIIMNDFSTTGDGLVAALQVLAVMVERGESLGQCGHVFKPMPQQLKNIRYSSGNPLNEKTVQAAIKQAEQELGEKGRILVRPSGTESVIRVMIECEKEDVIQSIMKNVTAELSKIA